jgi:hypothetical protein
MRPKKTEPQIKFQLHYIFSEKVEPVRFCSPRHRLSSYSRNEGLGVKD